MPEAKGRKTKTTRECPKCGSRMQKLAGRMALVNVRNRGLVTMPSFVTTGTGLIVLPQVCVSCGYVELYSAGARAGLSKADLKLRFPLAPGSKN